MRPRWRLPFVPFVPFVVVLLPALSAAGAPPPQAAPAARIAGQAATAALTDALPLDSQITSGTFPNGLRYLIRVNTMPEKRAELRLE